MVYSKKDIIPANNSTTIIAIKYLISVCWMPKLWSILTGELNKSQKMYSININTVLLFVCFVGHTIFARTKTVLELCFKIT